MEALYLLLAVPILWPFVARRIWHTTITWGEMGLNIGISVLLVVIVYAIGMTRHTADIEVLNGEITGKERKRVSCSHSYPCNCRQSCSGTGTSRTCTTICDTCYMHSYDIDWRVYTNLSSFNIRRLSSQGLEEPPRWTKVKKGEPVAQLHRYRWYVKAAKDSLFNLDNSTKERFQELIPAYPQEIYDYHRLRRTLPVKVHIPGPELYEYNQQLSLALRTMGPKRQANVVIVIVNTPDQMYLEALQAAWLGGKKNDVVVVLGTPNYPEISWAGVITWSDSELFKVKLRDDLRALGTASPDGVIPIIQDNVMKGFVRKKNEEFEYLKKEIKPPVWLLCIGAFLGLGSSVGLSILFHKNDMVNASHWRTRRRRR